MIDMSRSDAHEYGRQAEPEERIAAVLAVRSHASQDDSDLRYARLTGELARLSAILGEVERELLPQSRHTPRGRLHAASDAECVRGMIASRRRRSRFFPSDMFADPAWDILLDLYLAELEQRQIMVSSLCVAADVPATTALRWITALIDRGMLARQPDNLDRRRVYVHLTQVASEGMRSYLGCETLRPELRS